MENMFNQLILNKIYIQLSLADLRSCSIVNKSFNKAYNLDFLWQNLFQKHYGDDIKRFGPLFQTDSSKMIYQKYKELTFLKKFFKLDYQIDKLVSLQELYLYNNNLTSIPAEIGNLTLLQKLYDIITKTIFGLVNIYPNRNNKFT